MLIVEPFTLPNPPHTSHCMRINFTHSPQNWPFNDDFKFITVYLTEMTTRHHKMLCVVVVIVMLPTTLLEIVICISPSLLIFHLNLIFSSLFLHLYLIFNFFPSLPTSFIVSFSAYFNHLYSILNLLTFLYFIFYLFLYLFTYLPPCLNYSDLNLNFIPIFLYLFSTSFST